MAKINDNNNNKKTITMIKLILAILMAFISTFANAQLRGSGKTITKTYDYQNFDKLSFQDLDGSIEVEVGKEYSISVTIDDNLFPLLSFEENKVKKELKLFFKGNANNKKYIEDTKIRIKITTPRLLQVNHSGNSALTISTLLGSHFKLENSGNGTTTDIQCTRHHHPQQIHQLSKVLGGRKCLFRIHCRSIRLSKTMHG